MPEAFPIAVAEFDQIAQQAGDVGRLRFHFAAEANDTSRVTMPLALAASEAMAETGVAPPNRRGFFSRALCARSEMDVRGTRSSFTTPEIGGDGGQLFATEELLLD